MSLLYGGIFIICFGRMRQTYKAAVWARVCNISILFSPSADVVLFRRAKNKRLTFCGTDGFYYLCLRSGYLGMFLASKSPPRLTFHIKVLDSLSRMHYVVYLAGRDSE